MASTSETKIQRKAFYEKIKHFPPVINGRINIMLFLDASSDLVILIERLGKIFAPVKYDMQGNIEKIKKLYKYDENSCLLELMIDEISKGQHAAAEGVLWLNRAFHFFEIVFQEMIICIQEHNYDASLKKIFTVAYEGSIKKHHSWVTQQIFVFICKMSPTLPQVLKSIEAEKDFKKFLSELTNFNIKLHLVRCKIDDFFKEHNLFDDNSKY